MPVENVRARLLFPIQIKFPARNFFLVPTFPRHQVQKILGGFTYGTGDAPRWSSRGGCNRRSYGAVSAGSLLGRRSGWRNCFFSVDLGFVVPRRGVWILRGHTLGEVRD